MEYEEFTKRLVSHVEKALLRHPAPHMGFSNIRPFGLIEIFRDLRKLNQIREEANRVYSEPILYEELVEAAIAEAKKDYAEAIDECFDAIAVLWRAIEMFEKKMEKSKYEA